MSRTGYLANLFAVPPLIFKFQFHPEMLSEKRAFDYKDDLAAFGPWGFAKTRDAGFKLAAVGGFLKDLEALGPQLVATKPLRPESGKPRTFALEFVVDARPKPGDPGLLDEGIGRIEPDLAVLRSFVNPGIDIKRDLIPDPKAAFLNRPTKPPSCTLKLGDIDLECVMNDLNIKITKFKPDLSPERAEVSLTLSEQTASATTVVDFFKRKIEVVRSYERLNGEDWLQQVPVVGTLMNAFD